MGTESLQDQYAPNSICFGCGPKNEKGLRIKSFVASQNPSLILSTDPAAVEHPTLEMEFFPEPHHEAFPGMVNGGIVGALLDCHSNWAAAYTLMKQANLSEPPCTVTADFHVKLRAPTPSKQKIRVRAKAVESTSDRAKIDAQLFTVAADGSEKLTATCTGTFVAVKEGHPAFHRWG